MKRKLLTLLFFGAAFLLYSQSVHFGTAAVSGDDEFDSYYSDDIATGTFLGASNSFPRNTVVSVTNPGNGKSVSVTIVKRLSQPGLFLVLSSEAGREINLPEDDVLDIEAVETRLNEEVFANYADDKPFSEDPDNNPSVELAEPEAVTEIEEVAIVEETPSDEIAEPVEADTVDASEADAVPVAEMDATELESSELALEEPSGESAALVEEPVEDSVSDTAENETVAETSPEVEEPVEVVVAEDPLAEEPLVEEPEVSEPEVLTEAVPLPEEFGDTDLPDTFDPLLPGEEEEENLVVEDAEPSEELAVVEELPSVELSPEILEATVDDLLITEVIPEEPELVIPSLEDLDISEPLVGELSDEETKTVIEIPEISDEEEILSMDNVAEPVVEVPEIEEEPAPIIISADDPESDMVDTPLIEEVVVAEPEPDLPEAVVIDEDVEEPIIITPDEELDEPIIVIPDEEIEEPEEELVMTTPADESDDNVIYFLTPGDFRPPPRSEKKEDKEKEKEPEKKILPVTVARTELEHMIVRELNNGGSYLQLGTYSNVDILYSTIERINDSYPTIVLTQGEDESQVYKLLIGPISRDEKGVVITRFRSLGYGDAFLYRPH